MSAAVVSGAVALLLESKPTLTPLLVKLALQGSAQFLANDGLVAAGAGRLDLGACRDLRPARYWSRSVKSTPRAFP